MFSTIRCFVSFSCAPFCKTFAQTLFKKPRRIYKMYFQEYAPFMANFFIFSKVPVDNHTVILLEYYYHCETKVKFVYGCELFCPSHSSAQGGVGTKHFIFCDFCGMQRTLMIVFCLFVCLFVFCNRLAFKSASFGETNRKWTR